MNFIIYHSTQNEDVFVVTDAAHNEPKEIERLCGQNYESVGEFPEMGKSRVAFDEQAAKRAIADQGYFRFHAKTVGAVMQTPSIMLG